MLLEILLVYPSSLQPVTEILQVPQFLSDLKAHSPSILNPGPTSSPGSVSINSDFLTPLGEETPGRLVKGTPRCA